MPARTNLADATVVEVVVRLPKTLAVDARVAEARADLYDDHVHMLLLTDRGRLVGTLIRDDLPPLGSPAVEAAPALPHAVLDGRIIPPGYAADAALRILVRRGQRRLAVVDADGVLLGLLCLKHKLTGFCSDADVAAGAADKRRTNPPEPGRHLSLRLNRMRRTWT